MTQKSKFLNFNKITINPVYQRDKSNFDKVTSCNEKCNFFILLSFILLKCITLIQFFFVGTGSPRPNFRYIIYGKNNESAKYMIYEINSNILSKWREKIFYIVTIPIQWIRRIGKDTKIIPTL